MITKQIKSKKPSLEELVFGALSQLQALHYNDRSIRRYQSTWTRLIKFAKEHNCKNRLTRKLIIDFLEHHKINSNTPVKKIDGWRKYAEYNLKILWQFYRYGYFERLYTVIQVFNISSTMKKVLQEYADYCKEKRYISDHCYNERIKQVGLFLDFANKRGANTFRKIQAHHLSEFVISLWRFSARTVSRIVSDIRQFLKYLFLTKRLLKDISQALPMVHVAQDAKIPSVWDKELLGKLLSAVDRSSPRGKRDYAILLLACRLGLRVSEIRNLTLDQINWETETITITQSKTQRSLTLPLTEEVGNALINYIKYARPKTQYRQVFLKLRPPFIPFSKNTHFYEVVDYWRELAQIKFRKKQHHGLHSLRHSLATYLLEESIPFSVISNILGHESTNSTMIYAKSSVEMLRQVALSLKEMDDVK